MVESSRNKNKIQRKKAEIVFRVQVLHLVPPHQAFHQGFQKSNVTPLTLRVKYLGQQHVTLTEPGFKSWTFEPSLTLN